MLWKPVGRHHAHLHQDAFFPRFGARCVSGAGPPHLVSHDSSSVMTVHVLHFVNSALQHCNACKLGASRRGWVIHIRGRTP